MQGEDIRDEDVRAILREVSGAQREAELLRVELSFVLNPFDILNVPYDVTEKALARSFRRSSVAVHPDKVKPQMKERAEQAFAKLQQAMAVLRDPLERKKLRARLIEADTRVLDRMRAAKKWKRRRQKVKIAEPSDSKSATPQPSSGDANDGAAGGVAGNVKVDSAGGKESSGKESSGQGGGDAGSGSTESKGSGGGDGVSGGGGVSDGGVAVGGADSPSIMAQSMGVDTDGPFAFLVRDVYGESARRVPSSAPQTDPAAAEARAQAAKQITLDRPYAAKILETVPPNPPGDPVWEGKEGKAWRWEYIQDGKDRVLRQDSGFMAALRGEFKLVLIEREWQRRQLLAAANRMEGEALRRAEEAELRGKRAREAEKAREETLQDRVDSWRQFKKGAQTGEKSNGVGGGGMGGGGKGGGGGGEVVVGVKRGREDAVMVKTDERMAGKPHKKKKKKHKVKKRLGMMRPPPTKMQVKSSASRKRAF